MARPDRLDISIDHYRVLGVAVGADGASIRRAYLAAAREHHPDRVIGADAARRQLSDHKMRAANEAWRILGDADLKQQYDRERGPSRGEDDIRVVSGSCGPDVCADP